MSVCVCLCVPLFCSTHTHTHTSSFLPGDTVEFGAIVESENFFQPNSTYDGILGLAYVSIAAVSSTSRALRLTLVNACHILSSLRTHSMLARCSLLSGLPALPCPCPPSPPQTPWSRSSQPLCGSRTFGRCLGCACVCSSQSRTSPAQAATHHRQQKPLNTAPAAAPAPRQCRPR